MKKIFLLFYFLFSIYYSGFSQNPLVKMWDYRFGGSELDWLSCFLQTSDGGYILGGFTLSNISGNKTQNSWGNYDYWIVKIDSLGNKQWDKDFGGISYDFLYSIQQTFDGGYILGGYSFSHIGGNKTQNTWNNSIDYWIVKTDSLGNIQWDKDIGGSNYDYLRSIRQTIDGGYILGGYSNSNISGDKTQDAWNNSFDYWIVKTDSLGNKQWDKAYGGIDSESLHSIHQTADGGYILGGYSLSDSSGDKTQNSWGSGDYWIVKTDSLGNKEWDKDYGGTETDELFSIQQVSDGGYVIGGSSESNISGNKTQNTWGLYDFWIVKTDSLGNMQWDKDLGGTDTEDEFGNIIQTSDGGYLISGTSYSAISGDKTEANLAQEQTWILKTDLNGNKQWDKTIHTTGHDEQGLAIQAKDGCFAVANFTDAGIGGYKTQASWNLSPDYWIIKFCDTTANLTIAFTSNQNLCAGTCTDFINLSQNATSYQWILPGGIPDTSFDINPTNICYSNPGNYDVQLIATNIYGSDTLLLTNYITVFPSPPPQSITQSGDTLFANNGVSMYQWYFNGNLIPGATDYFYVAIASGDYNLITTDTNGCEVEAVINNVIAAVASRSRQSIQIYPNPVLNELKINDEELTGGKAEDISIYNMMGEKIFSAVDWQLGTVRPDGSVLWRINCTLFPAGLYCLEIISGKKIYRTKFIKQ